VNPHSHQAWFHNRWPVLRNPHVRALAWLLDAPGLLDEQAPAWAARVQRLGPADAQTHDWIAGLDLNPAPLLASLQLQPFTRLGRYAESLLAYYLRAHGLLLAHNLQLRDAQGVTLGEFDFLLRWGGQVVHWEFATKLYLLRNDAGQTADGFVGPGLADTLGGKIRKVMEQQLALASDPAAAAVLPAPVDAARARIKGWLFYPRNGFPGAGQATAQGLAPAHCRGFWSSLGEFETEPACRYALLPRLAWLAPARLGADQLLDAASVRHALAARLGTGSAPLLLAVMEECEGAWIETERGFLVPDDWPARARHRPGP
jgi:uncharacterized protein